MSIERQTEIMEVGYKGSTFISDTAVHTGQWFKIVPIETSVFTTLTDTTRDGNTLEGESFPANHELFGDFQTITLSSGAVVAYK